MQWKDNNVRTGYLHEYVHDGKTDLNLSNERGDTFINGHSITEIANDIAALKYARIWKDIFSTQKNGLYEIPTLYGTEVLLTYGYLYRKQYTMIMPIDSFISSSGAGGLIFFSDLIIEVPDTTHISVSGNFSNDYLLRVFVR